MKSRAAFPILVCFGSIVTLPACKDKGDDGACEYVDVESATCVFVEDASGKSLVVTGDEGTVGSTAISDDTICYTEGGHALDASFSCTIQELESGGCDPAVLVVDLGGCSLEFE